MNSFREKKPMKRAAPKAVTHYGEYKHELRKDYHSRCGYCNDSDVWNGGWRFFQLDHFVPRKYLVKISENEYSNLIYSCFFCNNSKRAKWPTGNEQQPNDGTNGFVHPVEDEYIKHLTRDDVGNITAITDLGKYMVKAMKLDLKRHAIIWNLERLESLFDKIEVLFDANKDKIPDPLAMKIAGLFVEHRKYSKLLRKEADA